MAEAFWLVLFLAAYIVLVRWVLPRLGVPTWMANSCRVESRPASAKDHQHGAGPEDTIQSSTFGGKKQ